MKTKVLVLLFKSDNFRQELSQTILGNSESNIKNIEKLISEHSGVVYEFSRIPCIGEKIILGTYIWKVYEVFHRLQRVSNDDVEAEIQCCFSGVE